MGAIWHVYMKWPTQISKKSQMKTWIIFYSGSTVNIFYNPDLLNNIKKVDEEMHMQKMKESKSTIRTLKCHNMEQYGMMRKQLPTSFSLKDMILKHQVTLDLNKEYSFKIHLPKNIIKLKSAQMDYIIFVTKYQIRFK